MNETYLYSPAPAFTHFPFLISRIRTYEHEAMWGKALTSYDLHSTLPDVTRQVGIVEVTL